MRRPQRPELKVDFSFGGQAHGPGDFMSSNAMSTTILQVLVTIDDSSLHLVEDRSCESALIFHFRFAGFGAAIHRCEVGPRCCRFMNFLESTTCKILSGTFSGTLRRSSEFLMMDRKSCKDLMLCQSQKLSYM